MIERQDLKFQNIENKDGVTITANLFGTLAATAGNYGLFFTAIKACEVLEVKEVHENPGTDLGAVTLQIEKLTGTTAKGGGTNILTSAISLKGNADTVVSGTINRAITSGVVANQLNVGDRLALKLSGTPSDVAGVQVTVYLKPRNKGDYR